MEPRVDQSEQERIRFAADIAACLSRGRGEKRFDEVILVAPPHFLGLVRKSLDAATSRLVRAEIDKDLSQLADEEIRTRLVDHL